MFSAVFIFEPGTYDDKFHELNALIDGAFDHFTSNDRRSTSG